MMVELGVRLYFAAGSDKNIKLTTKDDPEMFKAYLKSDKDNRLKQTIKEEHDMSKNSMREIQLAILEIFKIVSKALDENNLRYFAIGGTCLGAVRHEGFIPWDDDMDIAMPNKDYQKFIEIAPHILPKHLKLVLPDDQHYNCLSLRVHNTETTFIEEHVIGIEDRYMGVWLDIMPLYGVPTEPAAQKRYARKIVLYRRLNHKRKMPFSTCKSLRSKGMYILSFPINCFVSNNFWLDRWKALVSEFDFDTSQYTGYVWWPQISELIFPIDWFSDYVNLKFEDTVIRCPKQYDKFLSQMFGNYMELPPENERYNHSGGKAIIDLEKSYKEYMTEKK